LYAGILVALTILLHKKENVTTGLWKREQKFVFVFTWSFPNSCFGIYGINSAAGYGPPCSRNESQFIYC
jgi:hypothetical protein